MSMPILQNYELYRQGAEGKLFLGEFLGQKAIAKLRFSKKYRHPSLDSHLTQERLKSEVRSLIRCKTLGIKTPTIYCADIPSATIIMEFFDQAITCKEFIFKNQEQKNVKNLELLSSKLGGMLGRMHRGNIIHGDLTTSNILVNNNSLGFDLIPIDFGLAKAEGNSEDKGVDLYVLERAMLSTHPHSEFMFEIILNHYQKQLSKKQWNEVKEKYEDIRMRGRKRTMVG